MPVARPESSDSRVIAHVDMDCFYVQVEQRKQPELRGLPTAVVQYNEWKGGALIAVSYEARKLGVKRSMRGDEAKAACPDIRLVQVPVARGKADLNSYRNAGSEVVSILARKGRCERASIDEVYLDLTESAHAMLMDHPPESLEEIDEEALKSHILGLQVEDGVDEKGIVRKWLSRNEADPRDKLLACGALIVAELRMQVLKETEFTCSAGVAHNKMLAKLASAMNKPAQQTVVPFSSVKGLLDSLPIKKMKQLGGKLGTSLQNDLGVETVGELLQFSEEKLQDRYGFNTGTWLWNIARGVSGEEVQGRLLPKSHGSGKSFPGPRALKSVTLVQHWLNQLCDELNERLHSDLNENKRIAHTLTLHATAFKNNDTESNKKFPSKSCPLRYGSAKIQEDAFNLFQAALREFLGSYSTKAQRGHQNEWGVTALSVSASKIADIPSGTSSIMKYFRGQTCPLSSMKQDSDDFLAEDTALQVLGNESCSELKQGETQLPNGAILSLQDGRWPACEDEIQESNFSLEKEQQDGFSLEASPLFGSVGRSSATLNPSNQQGQCSKDDSRFQSTALNFKRKRDASKHDGTILKFFTSRDSSCSSTRPESVEIYGELISDARSQPLTDDCAKAEPPDKKHSSNSPEDTNCRPDRNTSGEAWNYKFDEVDLAVIEELPLAIQDEIRAWLRLHKQQIKRGPTIADYFSPTRKR